MHEVVGGRLVKVLSILMMLTGLAAAGPVVTPPAGWTGHESMDLAKSTGEIGHFGAHAQATIGAAEIKPPTDLGVTLFATRAAMTIANDPAAVRAEVDTFHGASQRAQLTGSVVQEQGWQEKADDKQVEATLAFHDTTNHIASTSRMLVVATATQLIEVTGECLARDDADAAALVACKAALATLDPGAEARVAIALAPAGTAVPERAESFHSGPVLSEGSRTPLPPMVIRPDTQPEVDRRPVFIGAGIVLLACVFWWNMKRRAQLEEDEDDQS